MQVTWNGTGIKNNSTRGRSKVTICFGLIVCTNHVTDRYEKDSSKHYVGLDLTPRMIEVARSKKLEAAKKFRMHLVARK